jgi:hypothetical protein
MWQLLRLPAVKVMETSSYLLALLALVLQASLIVQLLQHCKLIQHVETSNQQPTASRSILIRSYYEL